MFLLISDCNKHMSLWISQLGQGPLGSVMELHQAEYHHIGVWGSDINCVFGVGFRLDQFPISFCKVEKTNYQMRRLGWVWWVAELFFCLWWILGTLKCLSWTLFMTRLFVVTWSTTPLIEASTIHFEEDTCVLIAKVFQNMWWMTLHPMRTMIVSCK